MMHSESRSSYEAAVVPPNEFALMLSVCREMGFDPGRICAQTGLQPELLLEPATRLSFRQIETLVRNAIRLSGVPHLGLLLAQHMTVSAYGMLGYAMMSCATLGQALDIGLRYHKASSMMMEIEGEGDERTFSIVARPCFHAPDLHAFMVEELFGGIVPVANTLAGKSLRPLLVQLDYPAPSYAERYHAHFGGPVEFGCGANRLVIDRELLDMRLPNADPVAARQCIEICEKLLPPADGEPDIVHAIRRVILGQHGNWPDMGSVARSLNMSERTLRRRIVERGCSFQQIVDEVRCDVAIRYLQEPALSLQDVAALTGFSETANFRRAFKRWTGGRAPSHYRASLQPIN